MKKLTKIAVLALSAALASQGARAGTAGDLILGLNNADNGGQNDYVIDLGSFATLSGTANVTQSLGITTSALEATGTGLNGGPVGFGAAIVGGKTILGNTGDFVFTTTLDNGTGTALNAGSTAPAAPNSGTVGSAAGVGAGLKNAGVGLTPSSSTVSFTSDVSKDSTTSGTGNGNFSDTLGSNPMQQMTGDTITLDLWIDSISAGNAVSGWVYEGDVTIDLSGSTAEYTYDLASAVPEPGTYGLFAGGGLLLFALGRQFRRQNA
jgi:hypothetical protein